jgi:hypothetical protein
MPSKDSCTPQVIRALDKEGWGVVKEQYTVALEEHLIFADLLLQRGQAPLSQRMIILEVKCFTAPSGLSEFYQAMGQYVVYRNALSLTGQTLELYLVVPKGVYDDLFHWPHVRASVLEVKMKIVVVNLTEEQVVEWIH